MLQMKSVITIWAALFVLKSPLVYGHGKISPQLFQIDLNQVPWDQVKEHRIATKQNPQVQIFTLDTLRKATMQLSIDSGLNFENLRQARQKTLQSFGQLLPRFTLLISPEIIPIDTNNFISNLFGPLIPANWLRWYQQRQFYDAKKAEVLDHFITQVTSSTAMYWKLHHAKMVYGMTQVFKEKVDQLITFLLEQNQLHPELNLDTFHIDILSTYAHVLNEELYQFRQQVLQQIPTLTQNLDLLSDPSLVEIDQRVITEPLKSGFLNSTQTSENALDASINLKMWQYLIKAAEYSYKSTIFGVLSAQGGAPEDFRAIGLSFGLDTISKAKINKSQIEESKLMQRNAYRYVQTSVSKLVSGYNENLREYHQLMTGTNSDWNNVTRVLEDSIKAFNESGKINIDIHHFEFMHVTFLRRIRLIHDHQVYLAMLEQFLVEQPLSFVLDHMPARKVLQNLEDWAKNGYANKPNRLSKFKKKIKHPFQKRKSKSTKK